MNPVLLCHAYFLKIYFEPFSSLRPCFLSSPLPSGFQNKLVTDRTLKFMHALFQITQYRVLLRHNCDFHASQQIASYFRPHSGRRSDSRKCISTQNAPHNPGIVSWWLLGHIKLLCGPFTPFLKTSDTYVKMNESQPENKRLEVKGEQDKAVGRVTKIWAALLRKYVSILRRERGWLTSPKHPHRFWGTITLLSNAYLGGFYPAGAWKGQGMKLTTHPFLMPRFGVSWAVLTFLHSFMSCIGRTLY